MKNRIAKKCVVKKIDAKTLNAMIAKKQNWHDLFSSPDIVTYQIFKDLKQMDLISLAATNNVINESVFEFQADKIPQNRKTVKISDFETNHTDDELKIILSAYNDLEEIYIDQSAHCNNKLLQTLRSSEKLKKLDLIMTSENEFIKTKLPLDEINLKCYSDYICEKDPILDLLYSVEDVQFLRMDRGFLSPSSIVLINKYWFRELEFKNTVIKFSDSSFFYSTFQRCELGGLEKLSFIFTQNNASLARGFMSAQNSILKSLHESADNLRELTFTASGVEMDLQNLHHLQNLKNVTIYLNTWCNQNLRTSLFTMISNLPKKVQISIREFSRYDDLSYQSNALNNIASMRQEIRNINPSIRIFDVASERV